jgi:hypothetical protein
VLAQTESIGTEGIRLDELGSRFDEKPVRIQHDARSFDVQRLEAAIDVDETAFDE